MREIKHIVIHCTAGSATQTTDSIKSYWKSQGWKKVGYHWLISSVGFAEKLSNDDQTTNGVKGYNANAIHLCYKGGLDGKDTRTADQKKTLSKLVADYKKLYPKAEVLGHRDLSPDLDKDGVVEKHEWVKLCPCFDAKTEYKN